MYDQLSGLQAHISTPQQEAALFSDAYCKGISMDNIWRDARKSENESRVAVIGHRGMGKNKISAFRESSDCRLSIMENTILSFNTAAKYGADFVEFDVQVTKDGCPIVFHDDRIVTSDEAGVLSKRISELTVEEFLSIGFQKNPLTVGKVLLRKAVEGSFTAWSTSINDSLCTLQDAFEQVSPSVGFNIELKFDDKEPTSESEIRRTIDATLQIVTRCGENRKLYFSSFHPDAVQILRREQSAYPVFFLTDGGVKLYVDPRRNSIDAAIEVCLQGALQGIVSEVNAIVQKPEEVTKIHDAALWIFTYGELNNVAEVLHKQEEMGVDGIIVDYVPEMVTESRKGERVVELTGELILLKNAAANVTMPSNKQTSWRLRAIPA